MNTKLAKYLFLVVTFICSMQIMHAKTLYIYNKSTYTGTEEIGIEYKTVGAGSYAFGTSWINHENATYTTTINGNTWFVIRNVDVTTNGNNLTVNVYGRRDADNWGAADTPVDFTNKEEIYLCFDPDTGYSLTDITKTIFLQTTNGGGRTAIQVKKDDNSDATIQGFPASGWADDDIYKTTIEGNSWYVFTFTTIGIEAQGVSANAIKLNVFGVDTSNANQKGANNLTLNFDSQSTVKLQFDYGNATLTKLGTASNTRRIYVHYIGGTKSYNTTWTDGKGTIEAKHTTKTEGWDWQGRTTASNINGLDNWWYKDIEWNGEDNVYINVYAPNDTGEGNWAAGHTIVDFHNKAAVYLEYNMYIENATEENRLYDCTKSVFVNNTTDKPTTLTAYDSNNNDISSGFSDLTLAALTSPITLSDKYTISDKDWYGLTFTTLGLPSNKVTFSVNSNNSSDAATAALTKSVDYSTKSAAYLLYDPDNLTLQQTVLGPLTLHVLMQNDESVNVTAADADDTSVSTTVVTGAVNDFSGETTKWQWHEFSLTTLTAAVQTVTFDGSISGDDGTGLPNHTVTMDLDLGSGDLYYFFDFNTNTLVPITSGGPSNWVNLLPHAETFKSQIGASGRAQETVMMYPASAYTGNVLASGATKSEAVQLQSVHESREILYINTDIDPATGDFQASHVRLMLKCPYDTYQFYRFYRYDSRRPLEPNRQSGFFYAPSDNTGYVGATAVKYWGSDGVLYTGMNGGKYWAYAGRDVMDKDEVTGKYLPTTIACDVSYFNRADPDNDLTRDGVAYSEPTLAFRIIYELRPASEMATNLETCTDADKALETYNIIAPTKRKLNLTPKYPINTNYRYEGFPYFQGNYYVKCTDGVVRRITEAKFYETTSGSEIEIKAAPTKEEYEYEELWGNVSTNYPGGYIGHSMQLNMSEAPTTTGKRTFVLKGRVNEVAASHHEKVTAQDGSGNWYVVQDGGKDTYKVVEDYNGNGGYTTDADKWYYIAKFIVDVQDIDQVGPRISANSGENNGITGKEETTLLSEGWQVVNERRFDVTSLDDSKSRLYGSTAAETWFGEPLSWEETSCGFQYAPNVTNNNNTKLVYNSSSTVWTGTTPPLPFHTKNTEMSTYRLVQHTTKEATWMGKTWNANDFCMLIDAAQTQDQIAHLDLQEAKCPGTTLLFTAWVKNYLFTSTDQLDLPNLNFVIVGQSGTQEEETIQIFSTGTFGCVRQQTFNGIEETSTDAHNPSNPDNEWKQIAFEFTLPKGKTYDHLYLKLMNNGLNSQGNDFMIDDIVVYAKQASVTGTTMTPVCGTTADVKVTMEHSVMLQATELASKGTGYIEVGFTVVDDEIYQTAIANGMSHQKAWEASRVAISNGHITNGTTDENNYFGKFRLLKSFDSYTDNKDATIDNFIGASAVSPYAYRYTEGGKNYIYFITRLGGGMLRPGRKYSLVINRQNDFDTDAVTNLTKLGYYTMGEFCDMNATFTFENTAEVHADGSPISDNETFCAMRTPTFNMQRFTYKEGGTDQSIPTTGTYSGTDYQILFDWFRGTDDQSQTTKRTAVQEFHETLTGKTFSLSDALVEYRKAYSLSSDPTEAATGTYTADMRDAIIAATTSATGNPDDAQLVLARATFSPYLGVKQIYDFFCMPLEATIPAGYIGKICTDERPFLFNAKDVAPRALVGLPGVDYPHEEVALRLGLEHIANATATGKKIKLPLRSVSVVTEGSSILDQNTASTSPHKNAIYLVGTDDPQFAASVASMPIVGRVPAEGFKGNKGSSNTAAEWNNTMSIYFLDSNDDANNEVAFATKAREGYTYKLKMFYQERNAANDGFTNACEGDLTLVLKVVPKYETWTGAAGNNDWNNDLNWGRTEPAQIYKNTATDGTTLTSGDTGYYPTNTENTTANGFAPLSFTNITLDVPTDAAALAAYRTPVLGEHSEKNATTDRVLAVGANATSEIEYDMAIKENDGTDYSSQTYYERTVNDLYLKPGAELMNAHLLGYKKAHVDYELTPNRWYLLSSPLKNTLAGDMYTVSTTARQETDAFADITYSTARNNRYNPAVYQRSWDKESSVTYNTDGSTNTVFLKAHWSFVYNDVDVPYTPGTGFSIKVVPEASFSGNTLFRLPKTDTAYDYYTSDGTKYGNKEVSRASSGRLFADDIATEQTVTISNSTGSNPLFLVGNPFPTQLDMAKFFEVNKDLETTFWLMTPDGNEATLFSNGDALSTTSTDLKTLAPMQGFFVKQTGTNSIYVKFTKDMMKVLNASDITTTQPLKSPTHSLPVLRLQTVAEGQAASAIAVAQNASAQADYVVGEDAEVMLSTLTAGTPQLYTAAGNRAVQINQTPATEPIPLGIVNGEAGATTTVVVTSGASQFLSATLYDAQTMETLPLSDGTTFELQNGVAGRYFLCLDGATQGISETTASAAISISAQQQVLTVASTPTLPLTAVQVWTLGGQQVAQMADGTASTWTAILPAGTYVVRAANAQGSTTRKLLIP